MKKLFLLLMTVILTTTCAFAQAGLIKGTVVSASDNEPLPGASVVAPDGQGVATNLDGEFQIRVAEGALLKVSYVGHAAQTVKAANGMVVKLAEDNQLEEVVVTGYGSAKKLGSFVGAASVVGAAQLENTASTNFVDALQGKVAGLGIFSNTGEPAAAPGNVNIRGYSSLQFDSDPLYILDGSPVTSSVFTALNPNDIENITVLKDAASTAIYGSRAGNGVIVVTTKRGKMGEQAKVTIRATGGWSAPVQSKIKMMNSKQYLQFRDMMTASYGATAISDEARNLINIYGIDTDWQKELVKDNAGTYNLEAAIQGGGEKSNYYLSVGHLDRDGLIAKSALRRENVRASFNADIKPWLRVGFSGNFAYEKYQSNTTVAASGNFYTNGTIFQSYYMLPYDSPYYYTFNDNGGIEYGDRAIWYKYTHNGVGDANFEAALNSGSTNQVTVNASIYEEIRPIKGLTLRAQQNVYAYDRRASTAWNAVQDFELPMGGSTSWGQYTERLASESFGRLSQFTYTNTAEYTRQIGDHEFTVLLGQESIINRTNSFGVSTSGQPSNSMLLITNGTEVSIDNVSRSIGEYIVNSYFMTADYNFLEKYYVNASYRRDGCSKFAPQHRWTNFWAAGLMWNAKNESFLQPYTWLEKLQLRANYGTAGNYSGLGNYAWHGALASGSVTYNGQPTLGLASMSTPDLTWETISQFSLGVNYGMFNNRLYGSVDYYIKDTHDMILDLPYSVTTGWSSGPKNIGSMRNQGVDFVIGSDIYRSRDWYVGVNVNFNYNKNEITELFNGEKEYRLDDYGMVYVVGENSAQLNTVRYVGVDPRDGKCIWLDKNGNETKVYSDENAVNLGKNYLPSWTGGFGFNASWKGLALRADFTWAADKYIYNWAYQQLASNLSYTVANQSVKMLDTWTPENPNGTMPAITEAIQGDTRYLENSSYMRMKNLTVSYTFPQKLLSKMYLSDLTFHFTGRNLWTITADGFTGQDPEYIGNGVRLMYPNTRQFEFGVEVSF
ncbi:MAG: TonB-dependent receptor [Muribaculaceae bacterium]|nr:TonB-dependent receptor [Muribaculaceae bacterium]